MKSLTRGQKIRLSELTSSLKLQVELETQSSGLQFDFSCFGLDENGKLSDDRYFVFYNQTDSPEKALRLTSIAPEKARFEIDLSQLPATIQRLVFVATIDGAGEMKQLLSGRFGLSEVAEFAFTGADFAGEKAIMVGEIYLKGEWRVAANGQGFAEGLAAVLRHFGGEEVKEEEAAAPVVATPTVVEPVAAAKPNLLKTEKVVLAKQEKVSIAKARSITATLEWQNRGDLDLYCFYVDSNGVADKIYYRNLGDLSKPPFIKLDGDSRTPGRETVVIARPDQLRYALIAAYSAVGNGIGSFKSYQPRAIITDDLGQSVTVPLMQKNRFSYWAAITLLDFTQTEGNVVQHVETYSRFAEERSPLLSPDGTFKMNVGPVEFKHD